jgi:hypothetical protein
LGRFLYLGEAFLDHLDDAAISKDILFVNYYILLLADGHALGLRGIFASLITDDLKFTFSYRIEVCA